MSDYLNKTEEQQFEEAKSWLKQNGTPIFVAIALAAAASLGWNLWKNHQTDTALKNSASYQQVMESYLKDPAKNTPLVETFIRDKKGSSYAAFAQLELAKQLVEKADFQAAKTVLEQALAESSDAVLQNVIKFRLAAVVFQLQQYDEALAILSKVNDSAWDLRKQVFVGDILAAKGDKVAAKSAYEQAKANAPVSEHMLIDIRLNNL